jgi:hypothetical protein
MLNTQSSEDAKLHLSWKQNSILVEWVRLQQAKHKRGKLPQEQAEWLETLGVLHDEHPQGISEIDPREGGGASHIASAGGGL